MSFERDEGARGAPSPSGEGVTCLLQTPLTSASPGGRRRRLYENSERFEKIVQGWKALAPRVYIYSYDMGLPARPELTAKRFANYKRWGLSGVMIERRPAWAVSGLNYWMEQRLMWDINADPQMLVDEFCNGLFGPQAGPVMKEFFHAVENGATWDQREQIINRAAAQSTGCVSVIRLLLSSVK